MKTQKMYLLIAMSCLLIVSGCTLVKKQLREKVMPVAEEKIPEMVIEELDEMVADGELTEKQREKIQELSFKLLVRLRDKAKIYLAE